MRSLSVGEAPLPAQLPWQKQARGAELTTGGVRLSRKLAAAHATLTRRQRQWLSVAAEGSLPSERQEQVDLRDAKQALPERGLDN